ncbi:MAG: diguanylate cyclase [Peptococcaceae bacterium]|nr:diguanylate cyclase [Peptococcaceae bacterium]
MERNDNETTIFKSSLKRKTLLLTGLLVLVIILIQFILSFRFLDIAFDQYIAAVEYGFDANIRTAVETLVSALEQNHQLYLDGVISEETSIDIASKMVRDSRYSSGSGHVDDGYFWADMADGYCVVHYNPANEGEMRWDWKDQEGFYYIREFIRLGDLGGGYSDFYFGKPGDEGGSHKKRGYTKKVEAYGWYISTGNYYEDTDTVIAGVEAVKRTDSITLFATSITTLIIGLILVSINLNGVVTPIISISKRVRQLSMGETQIESTLISKRDDEIGDLYQSILTVANVLHLLLEDINDMILEHEKGNIDYSFDTKEFLGDYKRLADSVLELAAFSMRDQLTGLPNRRGFDNRLDLEWQRAVREKTPVSILMMDIDRFKLYNDSFGHQQGDVTLRVLADVIKQCLKRSSDFTARWGGEEFVVLLPNTDTDGAMRVAEKIRSSIEDTEIPCDNELGRKATISIGVQTWIPGTDSMIGDFISAADQALYQAKESGRNRVCLYEQTPVQYD